MKLIACIVILIAAAALLGSEPVGTLAGNQTNTRPSPSLSYGLVVDCSGSMHRLTYLYDGAKNIVRANGPSDETFLVTFAGRAHIGLFRHFTSDTKSLLKGIDEGFYIKPGQTALYDAIYLSAQYLSTGSNPEPSRRKALVLITDGDDRNSHYNEEQLFGLLNSTNTRIYILSVTELTKDLNRKKYAKAIEFQNKLATDTKGRVFYPQNKDEAIRMLHGLLEYMRQQ
jgi:Ca-activated chloride channel homolog